MSRRPGDTRDLAHEKRVRARRARRLAESLSQLDDRARLHQYADELDREADELDREAADLEQETEQPAALPPVTQEQQQVQQQQAREPTTDPDKPKG